MKSEVEAMTDLRDDNDVVLRVAQRDLQSAAEERAQREAIIAERRAELIAEDIREQQGLPARALEVQPVEPEEPSPANAEDSGMAMRHGRIAIVAGMVVVLFVLWIVERLGRRPK